MSSDSTILLTAQVRFFDSLELGAARTFDSPVAFNVKIRDQLIGARVWSSDNAPFISGIVYDNCTLEVGYKTIRLPEEWFCVGVHFEICAGKRCWGEGVITAVE